MVYRQFASRAAQFRLNFHLNILFSLLEAAKPGILLLAQMAGIERGSHCRVNQLITCRQENRTC